MRETKITWVLDFTRFLIKVAGGVTVLYLSYAALDWPLCLAFVIPACFAVSALVDFAVIPLYLLTPENKAQSSVLDAIGEGDFTTALRVLKAHEKWDDPESQARPNIATVEFCRVDGVFAHAVGAT